ncbi:ABC-type sugar transport system, periplasmic component [Terriglobus roseus DSM 18391]|uniref:ABC-type sugar transport system, periplasmic component n=1 Tax=Terriglobus roseus (strain DSM 18391 / NRRL B-41598 / KBS 63) TaxID=926566 RepID=I3ZIH1_TERRK|nr:substrate-binding domain-containing protein [Terriglobus roseus]AFL89039.1 ABC-type sugar transport system, periplasmic component [Terriglobus roseus DSM 18391]
MAKAQKNLYLIPVLSKSLDILELLQAESRAMTLDEVHRRTGTSKATVYRALNTLVHRGYLAKTSEGAYRHVARPSKLTFGFGSQSEELQFSNEVKKSLVAAAASAGVNLVILDNKYDGATAVHNAETFVEKRVDLVIEFQVEHEVAAIIGDRIAAAEIPFIAIDIPHPNATFFGVDNYRVGMAAGDLLVSYATDVWGGKVEAVLGLDLPEAGQLVQGRILGAFEAIRAQWPDLPQEAYARMDGRGLRERSDRLVTAYLEKNAKLRHILIAAATDASALGAIDAARRLKRERHIAIAGQDCIPDAVTEMKRRTSPMVGSVSHEPASYGPALISLGMALLRGQTVAPYNYVNHRVVTRASLLRKD